MSNKNSENNFQNENPIELVNTIAKTLSDKKAEHIHILDLREITTLADYFIVCNGLSDVHVKSLSDIVQEKTRESLSEKPWRSEGLNSRRWVVLDYVNVVVHIFKPDTREEFGLEKMWSDAKITEYVD